MSRRIHLLIIDPQNDFCDLPDGPCGRSALPVAGADADMQRLARFIDASVNLLTDITVTLDSHHRLDIAHPGFWETGDGAPVAPFTSITAAQVRAGTFTARDAAALPRALAYLDALEQGRRYALMVWPVHCEIGTWGHNVHAAVHAAYARWEDRHLRAVHKLIKGDNPWTEHYSALQAEVPDPADPRTQLNRALLDELARADLLLIAGEASSHCVKATTEHLVEYLPEGAAARMIVLADCASPVPGFEVHAEAFFATLKARGARVVRSTDAPALLRG